MVALTVREIVEATKGSLIAGAPGRAIASFSTDTRSLKPGDLFVALKGKTFDGHAFVGQAVAGGAVGCVVSGLPGHALPAEFVVIQVAETEWALGQIAQCWRRRFSARLVVVTGSNGKTTTKEMAGSVLQQRYQVLVSAGNLNNLIGAPLTLLRLRPEHEAAVLELGMNARGEIHRMAEMTEPDVGVITNIGEAHLEFLGSVEEVAEAKAELLPFLAGDRVAILNRDDAFLRAFLSRVSGRALTFGFDPQADLRAEGVRVGRDGRTHFTLCAGSDRQPIRLNLPGRENVSNALAAAAVGKALGLDVAAIATGLERAPAAPMRMERILHPSGAVIVNDAYNANPTSMAAAVETFLRMAKGRETTLVLGDMLELGAASEAAHRRIGLLVARKRPRRLITVGERARAVGEEAALHGYEEARIHGCRDHAEARAVLKSHLHETAWVLLKASRGMGLERVLEGL